MLKQINNTRKPRILILLAVMILLLQASLAFSQSELETPVFLRGHFSSGVLLTVASPTRDINLEINTGGSAFVHIFSDALSLEASLTAPDGSRIEPVDFQVFTVDDVVEDLLQTPFTTIGHHFTVEISAPLAGIWALTLTGTDFPNGDPIVALVTLNQSGPRMGVLTSRDQYTTGDVVVLAALLFDDQQPVPNAQVEATISLVDEAPVSSVMLNDAGQGVDDAAGDGIYTGSMDATMTGRFEVDVIGTGLTGAGEGFTRRASAGFLVTQPLARFTNNFSDNGKDDDSNGLLDRIEIDASVQVFQDGQYNLSATLTATNGQSVLFNNLINLLTTSTSVIVNFDSEKVRSLGVDGPYTLSNILLQFIDDDEIIVADQLTDAHTTQSYQLNQFERPAILLTGTTSDFGIDTDNNGLFDILQVNIDMDVLLGGLYQWSARLVDFNNTEIDFANNLSFLSAGVNTIALSFEGDKIGQNGADGPYVVTGFLTFGAGKSLIASDVATTQAYNFTDFEGSAPSEAPEDIIVRLQEIVDDNPGECADKVEDALAKAQTALDELNKTPPDNQAALGNIEGSVGDLEAAVKDGVCPDPDELTDIMDQLAEIARTLAVLAIDDAIAQGGDPTTIAEAQQALADGDALRASGAFKDAVNKYKDALAKAESSLSKSVASEDNEVVPKSYALVQNYPNPFNPETEIRFQLPQANHVVIKIFNTLGQEIRTLVNGQYAVGYHSVRWDSKDNHGNLVPSGIYFYQLQAGGFSQAKKMILLR